MKALANMVRSALSDYNVGGNNDSDDDNALRPPIPTTSWTGGIYQGLCQCSTNPITAEMDPLIAAGFHNLT